MPFVKLIAVSDDIRFLLLLNSLIVPQMIWRMKKNRIKENNRSFSTPTPHTTTTSTNNSPTKSNFYSVNVVKNQYSWSWRPVLSYELSSSVVVYIFVSSFLADDFSTLNFGRPRHVHCPSMSCKFVLFIIYPREWQKKRKPNFHWTRECQTYGTWINDVFFLYEIVAAVWRICRLFGMHDVRDMRVNKSHH